MGDRVEDGVGDAVEVAAFEAGVVVDADAGEERDFLPAEPGDPTVASPGGQSGLLWGDLGAPGGEKLPDLTAVVHGFDATACGRAKGGPVSTWFWQPSHNWCVPGSRSGGSTSASTRDVSLAPTQAVEEAALGFSDPPATATHLLPP
jgi:hypothetical protein